MMNETKILEIENYVKSRFDKDSHRLLHIYNVKKVAVTLGEIYHADIPSVIVASYLHDATKHDSEEENIKHASSMLEKGVPKPCLHAYSASMLAKTKFSIEDEDILNAIKYHCSGRKGMSLLEKIIYVSDFIEEGRDFVSDELRELAKVDLDRTIYKIMIQTKQYILKNSQEFSCLTEQAIQEYECKGEMNERIIK